MLKYFASCLMLIMVFTNANAAQKFMILAVGEIKNVKSDLKVLVRQMKDIGFVRFYKSDDQEFNKSKIIGVAFCDPGDKKQEGLKQIDLVNWKLEILVLAVGDAAKMLGKNTEIRINQANLGEENVNISQNNSDINSETVLQLNLEDSSMAWKYFSKKEKLTGKSP